MSIVIKQKQQKDITMNMFKKVKETTIKDYLATVSPERKKTVQTLHTFIKKTVPKLMPYFANNMIGYGKFKYSNYKKETIDWPIIALSNRKQYVSIYVCSVVDGKYVAEKHKKKLGKVKVGRSCISFRELEDLSLKTLKDVLVEAAKNPGLQSNT